MGIETRKGYDVWSGRRQAEKTEPYRGKDGKVHHRNHLRPHANGRLSEIGGDLTIEPIHLWVYEYETGFSLSGATGQSFKTRSFFPRNRIQQSISVACQFPDQKSHADAVEWIRGQQKARRSSTLLHIYGHRTTKGHNASLAAEGYVKSVQRQHQRFVYAPELRFDFLVERILHPAAWADVLTSEDLKGPRQLPDWKTVIEKQQVFRRDPDAKPSNPPSTTSVGEAIEIAAGTGGALF